MPRGYLPKRSVSRLEEAPRCRRCLKKIRVIQSVAETVYCVVLHPTVPITVNADVWI